MNVPENLKLAKTHEWVRVDNGDMITVGISDHAQEAMTELVYVELPEVGRQYNASEEIAVVESVKSASDIYAPVGGEVTEVNDAVSDDPASVNNSPYNDGWLYKMKIADAAQLSELLDAAGYRESIS